MTPTASQIFIPVAKLRLDSENPRLPESLRRAPQSALLRFLHRDGVLEELAQSYLDNGFFRHEPLLVVQDNGTELYTVVEGNRRLAALTILHRASAADGLSFLGIDPSKEQLEQLTDIPCVVITNRDAVHAYLGFRHIGGLKTWPPEAKARYLLAEAQRLVADAVQEPFRELGRRIGSNAQGVRTPYLAIRVLLYARDEFGLNVGYVQDHRFGVWLRCMTSADIRTYIGLSQARTYQEIDAAVADVDRDRLAEVLGDLKSNGGSRALLADSRYVTTYGRALTDERAHEVLRNTRDLSLAGQIVDERELAPQAWRLVRNVRLFLDTLLRADRQSMSSTDLHRAVDELAQLTRSARTIVKDQTSDHDNDA